MKTTTIREADQGDAVLVGSLVRIELRDRLKSPRRRQKDDREEIGTAVIRLVRDTLGDEASPIPMRLTCPDCGALHIDEGVFATRVHKDHVCQNCGMVWRPAQVPTVGVRFLPGCKNVGE